MPVSVQGECLRKSRARVGSAGSSAHVYARVMADEVTPEDVRALQVLQLALAVGLVLFWGTILFLSQTVRVAPKDGALRLVMILSGAHVLVALSSWTASVFLSDLGLRGRELPIMGRLRAATIVRSALFEGAALMGAVVCMMAVRLGVAPEATWVWLNGTSSLVFLAVVMATFPTRERLERLVSDVRQRDAL
jgi:hypothetical protein